MSLILHLSDLHFGSKNPNFDDAKTELIPIAERESRQATILRTLKHVGRYLKKSREKLDVICVSGDITYAGDEKGFEDFSTILRELGSLCPPKTRIIVVPGNHDVPRGSVPSSSARYKLFRKHIRANHFVTPLLDGIDSPPAKLSPSALQKHYILDTHSKWVIIPINSSNYCQMIEPIAPILEKRWTNFENEEKKLNPKAGKVLEGLRVSDVARISIEQFEALEEILEKIREKILARGEDPFSYVRMAVLHHHLLPVTTVEEIKKYESFTNLGLLRHFLAKHRFDIVLHGHKHIAKRYWDYIPFGTGDDLQPHKLLVVSGGTLGETYHAEDEVCKLIRICPPDNACTVSLASIRGVVAGGQIEDVRYESILLWEARRLVGQQVAPIVRVAGKDVDETYNRILTRFNDQSGNKQKFNLICQIAEASTAHGMPQRYPTIDSVPAASKQQWFDKLVDWWQLSQPTLSKTLHFTHGDRIYRGVNQIENIIKLLSKRPHSSRAVVTLCRPDRDAVNEHKQKFPSFCFVQFIVRPDDKGNQFLDCIGYFRKQEMKYWWPVNVAELARLQKKVYDNIPKTGDFEDLQYGSITTFASIARVGSRPPQVSVPVVDRNLDQDRKLLWTMCYALFWDEKKERKKYKEEWEKVMKELVPEGNFDPDGVPIPLEGLRFLLTTIEQFAFHHKTAQCQRLLIAMKTLEESNEEFADTLYTKDENDARQKYVIWQRRTADLVGRMKTMIRKILDR